MAIVGNIIKSVIEFGGNYFASEIHPVEDQKKVLEGLLEKAKNTAFGKYYGFEKMLESDDVTKVFSHQVPLHSYKEIHSKWWKQQESLPDITWPGHPNFFARTSGTSGKKSKRIPVTDEMSESMRTAGTQLIKDLYHYDVPAETFEKEIFMLSSSCNLEKNKKGFLEGEISGINIYNFPDWYNLFYRPGKEIASIPDWDERIKNIVQEAPEWDISVIAGIPSWVKLMLQEIIKGYNLKNIHEMWPNLKVYVSGGVAFDPFKESFNKLTEEPLIVLDTYLASEGFFGYSNHPDVKSMKLVTNAGIYYEFIPFNERSFKKNGELKKKPEVLGIKEVENDVEYALIISTCSGAWRYMVGDTLKFTDKDNMQFVLTGRTKFFLNVVGSQLSENKLDKAVKTLTKKCSVEINQYSVGCIKEDEKYYHQWIIVCDNNLDEAASAELLDEHLHQVNNNYKVARNKALKGVRVKVVKESDFVNFLELEKKKGGQVKTPKVVGEDVMNNMLNYFSNQAAH